MMRIAVTFPWYKSQYFFHSHVMEASPGLRGIESKFTVKATPFVNVLNQVRELMEMNGDGFELLHESVYLPHFSPSRREGYITTVHTIIKRMQLILGAK